MAPHTLLIAGATGNTGRGVIDTLSNLYHANTPGVANHRILALTRSLQSPIAQQQAKLPGITVIEQNWVEITPAWLREHNVTRAFIASHNNPNQFAEESTFHVAALRAGVKYVVRISTTAANVHPDYDAYYARSHWAVEAMLDTPEFAALQWTSLQPNIFTQVYLAPVAGWVQKYRATGEQDTLRLVAAKDVPVGVVDPYEVGVLAARLLAEEDTARHNKRQYVVNGPENITGQQVVEMVEREVGTEVKDVVFKDLSFIEWWIANRGGESMNVMQSIKFAPITAWNGECKAETTSKEVLELAAPKRTPAEVLEKLLAE
ncbi:hypothetical protein N0V88_006340 [Collariella sp. IMI 366227]|nr:hypothetical protein N0V88_006340 [Collariella sp. IMI 366227]